MCARRPRPHPTSAVRKRWDAFLKKNGIIGIEGIDTRSLTRTLRESGVMNGAITTEFDPDASRRRRPRCCPRSPPTPLSTLSRPSPAARP